MFMQNSERRSSVGSASQFHTRYFKGDGMELVNNSGTTPSHGTTSNSYLRNVDQTDSIHPIYRLYKRLIGSNRLSPGFW